MLYVGHAVHQRQPQQTWGRICDHVQEHVEHHPLLQNNDFNKLIRECQKVTNARGISISAVNNTLSLPAVGSRSVLKCVCSQRTGLHSQQQEL